MRISLGVVLFLSLFLFLAHSFAEAQRKTARRPSSVQSMIKQSNLDYQLWENFELVQKANGGDPAAQHELGLRYLMGTGFSQDTLKGAYWIQKSAQQDFLLAHYNLGILFLNGVGVEWNPFESYKCFKIAAERNMPDAQYVLGLLLTEDLIVARDWSRAYRLIKEAAKSFDPAKKVLHEFEKRGIKADTLELALEKSWPKKSRTSARDSASKRLRPIFLDFDVDTSSHVNDSTLVSDVLREASSPLKNIIEASHRLSPEGRATQSPLEALVHEAEAGSPEALTLLGRMYEQGSDVPRESLTSAAYYLRALRLESPRAYELLWNLVHQKSFAGELEQKAKAGDPQAEFVWAGLAAVQIERRLTADQCVGLLQASSDRQNTQAVIKLGLCYQSGRWVKQDRAKAEELWIHAASLGSREAQIRLATISVARGEHLDSSLRILRQAFEEGSIIAQTALGYCNEKGIGTTRNKGEASRLYRDASKRGSENAYLALRRMHDEIRPKEKEFEMDE